MGLGYSMLSRHPILSLGTCSSPPGCHGRSYKVRAPQNDPNIPMCMNFENTIDSRYANFTKLSSPTCKFQAPLAPNFEPQISTYVYDIQLLLQLLLQCLPPCPHQYRPPTEPSIMCMSVAHMVCKSHSLSHGIGCSFSRAHALDAWLDADTACCSCS